MNNIVEFEITATPETALKKLSKAGIAVYKLKKRGSSLGFGVEREYVQKVFAIFAHPCYNIKVKKRSGRERLVSFMKKRFGLVIGAAAFCILTTLSSGVVFRIKIVGNGAYLGGSILSIAEECGARVWSPCRGMDVPVMQARIMSLPDVNFCSVQRAGSYLIIDVRTEGEHTAKVDYQPLKASVSGKVTRLVAVCGTAERSVGDSVSAGDVLIGAYEVNANGEGAKCLAVGFAEIAASASISSFYECESEENRQSALKAANLYSDRILESSCTARPCEGGVTYEVTFTYLVTVAVNME